MKIICPECLTSFDVPVPLMGMGRRVRCSNCKHIWTQEPVTETKGFGAMPPDMGDDDIDPIPASVHPQEPTHDEPVERGPGFFDDVNWNGLGRMIGGFVLGWVLIYGLLFGMLAMGALPGVLKPLAIAMGMNAGATMAGLEVQDVAAKSAGETTSVSGKLYNAAAAPRLIPMIELTPVMADGSEGDAKRVKPEQDMLKAGESVEFHADLGVKLDSGAGVRVRLLAE